MTDANLDAAPGDRLLDEADAELWDVLLESLAQGSVVPIVGRDLLTIGGGDKPPLYTELAARLAVALKISPDVASANPANPLGAVAAEHILRGQDSSRIYRSLAAILQRMEPLPIPAPLQQLAGIDKFNLFVTTTFDSLLERAVQAARERPRVYSYSTKSQPVADEDLSADGRPTIYQMFGKVSPLNNYVVTEEDALEFVFQFQSSGEQPKELLHLLSERTLLIIGCSFPTWFVRFFLRLSRGRRLYGTEADKRAFIVDPGAAGDAGLVQFLNAFQTRTEVFTQYSAEQFVAQLAMKWHNRPRDTDPGVIPEGAVFVSYAREDRARVQTIVEALQSKGLRVWFDREQLDPGVNWDRKIRHALSKASAFVPVVSKTSVSVTDRYFIKEWKLSFDRDLQIAFNDRFLFPVVIDEVDPNSPSIPQEFRTANMTRVEADAVPEGLVTALLDAMRRKKTGLRQ